MRALRPVLRRERRARTPIAALLLALIVPLTSCGDGAGSLEIVASSARDPFHYSTCNRTRRIPADKYVVFESREEALAAGHRPCDLCQP